MKNIIDNRSLINYINNQNNIQIWQKKAHRLSSSFDRKSSLELIFIKPWKARGLHFSLP
jgi:hypothetical protein